ncbi:MAG: iron-sulfur cluster assembly scaffold protein [Candidatus Micrarchaeia archaeon]
MAFDYDQLVEAYKHPRHRGKITGGLHGSAANVSCGDNISLHLAVDRHGTVIDAKHEGHGCALSVAAAEALCGYAIGKKLSRLCALDYDGLTHVLGFTPSAGRVGCVMVVLSSLKAVCERGIKKRLHK